MKNNYEIQETEEELRKVFYKNLTWYFGTKTNIKGALLLVEEQLQDLNKNLKKTDESSTKLSTAIKNLTIAGTIIAGLTLILEFIKFITALN